MRIFHVFKTYLPDTQGGMEECIRQLCLHSSKHGVENTVVTVSKSITSPEELVRPECRLIRFPETLDIASTPMSFSLFRKYRSLIQDADLIHYHFPWPFADLMHIVCGIDKPYIVTYQSDVVKQRYLKWLYAPLMRRFLGGAKAITVASPNYLKSSHDLLSYHDKCHVMPLGLDEQSYPDATQECRDYWQNRVGEDFFLFVGVLRYYKGLHFLVRTLQGSKHHVVIAGKGPMEKELQAEAKALGVESQITFAGFISDEDKVTLLQQCKGFVFPSHLRSEAFGISLLEAAMYARPLISCEIGTGTTFINQHNETGIVVPPENPSALRKAMDALSEDSVMASSMGAAARRRFESGFTASGMAEICYHIYQETLNV